MTRITDAILARAASGAAITDEQALALSVADDLEPFADGGARAPGSRPPRPRQLLAQGLHPADPALPRRLPLLHLRAGAARPGSAPYLSESTRRSRSPRPAPGPAATRRCSRSATSRSAATASAREALAALGHETTIPISPEVAQRVQEATGLLPHVNPGVMTRADLARLRPVSVSAGLMLESASERLCERGGPHHGCPDKRPAVRLETIRAAGEQARAVHQRHPDRHRRDAARARRIPARAARAARALRSSAGDHRPELPRQAGDRDGAGAGAVARGSSVDDRARAPRLRRRR